MDLWTINSKSQIKLSKEFYDLPLYRKYELILTLPEGVLNKNHEALVLAILQHSSAESKKQHPVQRERKISTKAKRADEEYIERQLSLGR